MAGTHQIVSTLGIEELLEICQQHGIVPERLLRRIQGAWDFIDWDACCELTTAFGKLFGRQALISAGESSWQHGYLREQAALAPLLLTSSELLETAFGPGGFCVSPFLLDATITSDLQKPARSRAYRITLDFNKRHIPEAVCLFLAGQLQGLPMLIDGESAIVEWRVDGNKADFQLRLPTVTDVHTGPGPGRIQGQQQLVTGYVRLLLDSSRSLERLLLQVNRSAAIPARKLPGTSDSNMIDLEDELAQISRHYQAWLILDRQGTIRIASEAVESLLGYGAGVLQGQPATAVLPLTMASRHLHPVLGAHRQPTTAGNESLATHSFHRESAAAIHQGRSIIPVRVTIEPLQANGQWFHACLLEDITLEQSLSREIDRLETRLADAQRLSLVGQMSGEIAHDFNNILSAIQGYLDLLEQDWSVQRIQTPQTINEIRNTTDRGRAMVRRLLDFSSQGDDTDSLVNINLMLDGIADMLRRLLPDSIEFQLGHGRVGAYTQGDPVQLEQVLLNLAVNARDAMPAGGTLRIAASEVGDELMITVEDTGTGMDPETQARIFEPFFSTRNRTKRFSTGDAAAHPVNTSSSDRGTGLGLAVCDGIIRRHGGSIEVSSRLGKGSRFVIKLRAAPAPGAQSTVTSQLPTARPD